MLCLPEDAAWCRLARIILLGDDLLSGAVARTSARPPNPFGMPFWRTHAAMSSTPSPRRHTQTHTRDLRIHVCVSTRPPHPLTMAGARPGAAISALLRPGAVPVER